MEKIIFGGFEIFEDGNEEALFSFQCYGRGSNLDNEDLQGYSAFHKLTGPQNDLDLTPFKNIILSLFNYSDPDKKQFIVQLYEPPRKENKSEVQKWIHQNNSKDQNRYLKTWDINLESSMIIDSCDSNPNHFIKLNKLSISERGSYKIKVGDYFSNSPKFVIGFSDEILTKYLTPIPWKKNAKTLSLQNNTGASILKIVDPGKNHSLVFEFDVRPEKLNYEETNKLFNDVYKHHIDLLFKNQSPVSLLLKEGNSFNKSAVQRLLLLEEIIDKNKDINLSKIIQLIARDPHKILQTKKELVNSHFADYPDFSQIDEIISSAYKLEPKTQFSKLVNQSSIILFDTPPNKFVKFVVNYFFKELLHLEKIFIERLNNSNSSEISSLNNQEFIAKSKKLRLQIIPLLHSPFFKEIDASYIDVGQNQVLLKEPRYQKITENYISYISKVELAQNFNDYFQNPLKWMPELYEYWCFFEINRSIKEVLKSKDKTKIILNSDDSLIENIIIIEYEKNSSVKLFYNFSARNFKSPYNSYSVNLRPDITLQVDKEVFIFDAKYRVESEFEKIITETENDKDIFERQKEEKRGKYLVNDIYKMHTYRDALRIDGYVPKWVISIYPGSIENFWYVEKNNFKKGGVGAIPLKPTIANNESSKSLENFLKNIFNFAQQSVI